MLDEYCERHGMGLFQEPFNTISNLVFIWAAVEAWNLAGRNRVRSGDLRLLIALSAIVGLGSAAWHMLATPWAKIADLIPILLFQLCFLWLYLRTCVEMKAVAAAATLFGYFVVSILMMRVPPYLNGSILYAPTILTMLCLAVYHYKTRQPDHWLLGIIAILFCLALTFRTIDLAACAWVSFGTHFLWHLFNGAVFYLAMRAIILKRAIRVATGDTRF
jgi:hypothetical protein